MHSLKHKPYSLIFLFLRACYFRSIPKHKSPKVEQRSVNVTRSPKKQKNKQKLVSRATVTLILQNIYVGSGVGPGEHNPFFSLHFAFILVQISIDLLHTHRFRHMRGYHRVRWARGVLTPSPRVTDSLTLFSGRETVVLFCGLLAFPSFSG